MQGRQGSWQFILSVHTVHLLDQCSCELDGEEHLEVVGEFKYSGSTSSQGYSLDHEVDRQISKASHTFHGLYRVV